MNKAQAVYASIGNEIFQTLISKLENVTTTSLPDGTINVAFDDGSTLKFRDGFAAASAALDEEVDYRNKFVVAIGEYEDVGDAENGPRLSVNWTEVHVFDDLGAAMSHMVTMCPHPIVELSYVDHDDVIWVLNATKRR